MSFTPDRTARRAEWRKKINDAVAGSSLSAEDKAKYTSYVEKRASGGGTGGRLSSLLKGGLSGLVGGNRPATGGNATATGPFAGNKYTGPAQGSNNYGSSYLNEMEGPPIYEEDLPGYQPPGGMAGPSNSVARNAADNNAMIDPMTGSYYKDSSYTPYSGQEYDPANRPTRDGYFMEEDGSWSPESKDPPKASASASSYTPTTKGTIDPKKITTPGKLTGEDVSQLNKYQISLENKAKKHGLTQAEEIKLNDYYKREDSYRERGEFGADETGTGEKAPKYSLIPTGPGAGSLPWKGSGAQEPKKPTPAKTPVKAVAGSKTPVKSPGAAGAYAGPGATGSGYRPAPAPVSTADKNAAARAAKVAAGREAQKSINTAARWPGGREAEKVAATLKKNPTGVTARTKASLSGPMANAGVKQLPVKKPVVKVTPKATPAPVSIGGAPTVKVVGNPARKTTPAAAANAARVTTLRPTVKATPKPKVYQPGTGPKGPIAKAPTPPSFQQSYAATQTRLNVADKAKKAAAATTYTKAATGPKPAAAAPKTTVTKVTNTPNAGVKKAVQVNVARTAIPESKKKK